ncbi:hypothetical protein BHE74_00016348 [Ensete ventricosum]|nr:hypothetical protein GW17_00008848 [Ensete ventricosum]RWW75616.1 hypothetical protein BHE74_00016348 [Ensete ventricosum]RZR81419.1 hypothetical protein BHM03_00007625 [Ensete ventricosum]
MWLQAIASTTNDDSYRLAKEEEGNGKQGKWHRWDRDGSERSLRLANKAQSKDSTQSTKTRLSYGPNRPVALFKSALSSRLSSKSLSLDLKLFTGLSHGPYSRRILLLRSSVSSIDWMVMCRDLTIPCNYQLNLGLLINLSVGWIDLD